MRKTAAQNGRWCALAAGLTTIASGPVWGLEMSDVMAFHLGPVTLRPTASLTETFTDNVYYQSSGPGRESDFITTAAASLSLSLGREIPFNPWVETPEEESNYISLNCGVDYPFHAHFSQLDAANYSFSLKDRWKGNHLSLRGGDSFQSISSLLGAGYGIAQNISRMIQADNYRLDYQLTEKTHVYLDGTHSSTDYEKNTPLYNDDNLNGTLGFGLKAFPKTTLFGEAYYGQSAIGSTRPDLPKGPHLTFMGGYLGAQGNFTPHLFGLLKVGYEVGEYSDKTPVPSNPVVEAALTHRFREKTATSLTYSRHTSVSVQAAGTMYTADNFGLRVDQKLGGTGRLTASLGASAEMGDYGSTGFYANRQDNWYRLNLSLSYVIKVWMTGMVGYEFEKFSTSSKGIVDYDVNRVTLRLAIGY